MNKPTNEISELKKRDIQIIQIGTMIVIGIVSLPFLWVITALFLLFFQPPCLTSYIPQEAVNIFLQTIFDSTANQDYAEIASIAEQSAIEELKAIEPFIGNEFEVLYGNDFLNENAFRAIEFENGLKVTLYFEEGNWNFPECRQEEITKRAIEENLKLTHIQVHEDSIGTE